MHHQGQEMASAEGCLSENLKREQRARLINALCRFKPHDASPQQFYNCVRELCIIHNCSIDEGLERAAVTWPKLNEIQRETYDSQRHAELPIPVPRHLLYHAFQKERTGMWSLGRSTGDGKRHTRYTVESYKPPPKPSRYQEQLQQRRPKYDNRLDLPPKVAATHAPPPKSKFSRASPSSMRRIRSLPPPPPPPPTIQRVQSIRHIQPMLGAELIKKATRHRQQKKLEKLCAPESVADPKASGDGHGAQKKKATKRKGSKTKKFAKAKDLGVGAYDPAWKEAIGSVRRRIMMHENHAA